MTKIEQVLLEKGVPQTEIDYLLAEFLEKEAVRYVVVMCQCFEQFKTDFINSIESE